VELIKFNSLFPDDKNGRENYRIDFSVLSTNLPIREIDLIEQSLSKFTSDYIQLIDEELSEKSLRIINEILDLINYYPNESLVIAIHRNKKGNSKSLQQSTDLVASKIEQLIGSSDKTNVIIQCIGFGDKRPLVSHKEEYARYMNQRIEFVVFSASKEE